MRPVSSARLHGTLGTNARLKGGGWMRIGLPGIVYLVIGAFVAQAHHYFAHADALKQVLAAALAVVLWPFIVVFGLHFHVT